MTVWIINQLKSKFKYYSLKKCSMVVSIVDELEDYESIWKKIDFYPLFTNENGTKLKVEVWEMKNRN